MNLNSVRRSLGSNGGLAAGKRDSCRPENAQHSRGAGGGAAMRSVQSLVLGRQSAAFGASSSGPEPQMQPDTRSRRERNLRHRCLTLRLYAPAQSNRISAGF